jgi:hypothetical protein
MHAAGIAIPAARALIRAVEKATPAAVIHAPACAATVMSPEGTKTKAMFGQFIPVIRFLDLMRRSSCITGQNRS